MDKRALVDQLTSRMQVTLRQAQNQADEAREDARSGASRAVNLARAQLQRAESLREALEAVTRFQARPLQKGERIGLGAVVEVEDGDCGRSLFVAPAGAGEELTGPGGDGFFQVVTPGSPFGRALMGKRVGDVVEVPLQGDVAEWTIVYAA